MKYRITHKTEYSSTESVSVGYNEAWLTPRLTPFQSCLAHELQISPEPSIQVQRVDYFQNTVSQFAFNQGYEKLTVTAINEVQIQPHRCNSQSGPAWEAVIEATRHPQADADFQAYEFTFDSPRCRQSTEFANYGQPSFPANRPIVECLSDIMQKFHAEFRFDATATTVSTPVEQVFRQKRGVCQDYAHLLISILRSLQLPARYVSGYLRTIPPPGKPRLVGADASHAWLSVYCGSLGWIDIDPTNNRFPSTDHITVAWGRDYSDVAPLKGVYIGGSSPHLKVSVDVVNLEDVA